MSVHPGGNAEGLHRRECYPSPLPREEWQVCFGSAKRLLPSDVVRTFAPRPISSSRRDQLGIGNISFSTPSVPFSTGGCMYPEPPGMKSQLRCGSLTVDSPSPVHTRREVVALVRVSPALLERLSSECDGKGVFFANLSRVSFSGPAS